MALAFLLAYYSLVICWKRTSPLARKQKLYKKKCGVFRAYVRIVLWVLAAIYVEMWKDNHWVSCIFFYVFVLNFKTELIWTNLRIIRVMMLSISGALRSPLKWVIKREMISEIQSRVYYFVYGRHCKYFLITIIYIKKIITALLRSGLRPSLFSVFYFILLFVRNEILY